MGLLDNALRHLVWFLNGAVWSRELDPYGPVSDRGPVWFCAAEMLRCVVLATHWNRLKVSVLTFWTNWVGTWPGFQLGLGVQLTSGMVSVVNSWTSRYHQQTQRLSRRETSFLRADRLENKCSAKWDWCGVPEPDLRKRHFWSHLIHPKGRTTAAEQTNCIRNQLLQSEINLKMPGDYLWGHFVCFSPEKGWGNIL